MADNNEYALQEDQVAARIAALTITEAFGDGPTWRALLIRLSIPVTGINRLMTHEGIGSAKELSQLRPSDLTDTLESVNKLFGNHARSRIYFSSSRIMKLKSLTVYLRRCATANRIPDIRVITADDAVTFTDHLDTWTMKGDSVQDAISGNDIKFDPSNFTKFRQKIETLASSTRSSRGVTLDYLLRADDNIPQSPIEEAKPDVFSLEFMIENTSIQGVDFKTDDQMLYIILRHYLTNTTGWNIIAKFSAQMTGRKAYKALRGHFEGSSYFDLMKTKANAMMSRTFYRGDTMKFTWEQFISIHLEAHRMFQEIGEPLTESMKILYLKGGIRAEAALEASLEVAKGLPNVSTNFDLFVNHITESVTNKRSRAETLKAAQSRQVSGLRGGRGRGGGRGGRFSSRGGRSGSFRGRGRGRGSYSYGNHSNPDIPETIVVEGKTLYPRRVYKKTEYDKLTYTQKGELMRAREKGEASSEVSSIMTGNRNIKAAFTDSLRDLLSSSGDNNCSEGNDTEPGSNNNSGDRSVSTQFKKRRTSFE